MSRSLKSFTASESPVVRASPLVANSEVSQFLSSQASNS
jgi:hypothetical protein